MQVAVVGAGAVGCYYGGQLLRAGHDVTFIGRQPHVDAINAHGLLLETQAFEGRLPAKAAVDSTSLVQPDLVLFCVKSADTEDAGRSLAGCLGPRTPILSLQNGVDNPQRLRKVICNPVIPAARLSLFLFLPDHITFVGSRVTDLPTPKRKCSFAATFQMRTAEAGNLGNQVSSCPIAKAVA